MDSWIKPLLALVGSFAALFAGAELLYRVWRMNAETTRKVVHVGTGLLALLFPLALTSHWQVLALCGSFAVLLWISIRYKLLPSINGIRRKSYGSLGYDRGVRQLPGLRVFGSAVCLLLLAHFGIGHL